MVPSTLVIMGRGSIDPLMTVISISVKGRLNVISPIVPVNISFVRIFTVSTSLLSYLKLNVLEVADPPRESIAKTLNLYLLSTKSSPPLTVMEVSVVCFW